MRATGMALLLAALTGCQTAFIGPATILDGPAGCKAACERWDMELAGMVKMGEYSDGCICLVKPGPASAGQAPAGEAPGLGSASGAAIAAAAGVYMQMVAAQQASMTQQLSQPPSNPYVPGSPIGSPGWRPGMP